MTEPLSDVRQISKLAYGFMASKALFAGLVSAVVGLWISTMRLTADPE